MICSPLSRSILEEAVIDALPLEEDPTDKPQNEQNSSDKSDTSDGGCNSTLLSGGSVTIILVFTAITTFRKRKREDY